MTTLGFEEEIILKLAKLNPKKTDVEWCRYVFENKYISSRKLFNLMVEHKVVLLVYNNMLTNGLNTYLFQKWRNILNVIFDGNQLRNKFVNKNVSELLSQFYDNGIYCAPLKGSMLNQTIYRNYNVRTSNDVDLLVEEKNLGKVTEILKDNDFIQGELKDGKIKEASRKQKLLSRMSSHELVPFIKKTEHSFCEYLIIDVQFQIFSQEKNLQIPFEIEKLFQKLVPLELEEHKSKFFLLKPEYYLIQLASHLYQDAVLIQSIISEKDIELMKYVDIYEFISYYKDILDWCFLEREVKQSNISEIMYYTLYHTEELFGNFVPKNFMAAIKPKKLDFLNKYGIEKQETFYWEKPFIDRVFDLNRRDELFEKMNYN
ncbi:TPA: nucleotidyltransferase family protein [Bacillus thuringiensis]|nr:nucleotidyltransferase family protein [Bacillus thuringiensis]